MDEQVQLTVLTNYFTARKIAAFLIEEGLAERVLSDENYRVHTYRDDTNRSKKPWRRKYVVKLEATMSRENLETAKELIAERFGGKVFRIEG